MVEVKNIFFKDFITFQRGFDLPKKDMIEGDYPVVGSTSIIGYHDEYKGKPPGVITGRSGSLGTVQYINDKYWPHNTALWVKDFKGNHPRYVYYFLQTLNLGRFNSGAGVPTLNRNDLDTLKIEVHSLPLQNKIASVLSAYDDLIENNNRRIKILEKMAHTIYKEWFVNFRFPGHEKVRMVSPSPSERGGGEGVNNIGMILEGWEVKTLGDICTIVMGQSPKSEFYNEDGNGLPFHQGVTDFGDRFPTDRIYCTVQNRIAEAEDILFSVRAPVGRINIGNKKMVIGRGLCAIRSRTGNQSFVFQQLKDKFQETDTMGGGTIFKSVTKEDVHDIKIIEPSGEVLIKFEEMNQPIFRKLEILTDKNKNLRKTSDFLLPKLISGEVDVEKTDIKIGNRNE